MGNNNSSSAAKGGTDIPTDDDDGGGDGGEHALIVAAEANDAAEIRRLHGLGADLDAEADGSTALQLAAYWGNDEAAGALLDLGASTNRAPGKGGWTPLYLAAFNGHDDTVRLLDSRGADVEQADADGASPLFVAAMNSHDSTVSLLHSLGADANQADSNGATPVHAAAMNGHDETIALLHSLGGRLAQPDHGGRTPVRIAEEEGHGDTVEVLESLGAHDAALVGATGANDVKDLRRYNGLGADLDAEANDPDTLEEKVPSVVQELAGSREPTGDMPGLDPGDETEGPGWARAASAGVGSPPPSPTRRPRQSMQPHHEIMSKLESCKMKQLLKEKDRQLSDKHEQLVSSQRQYEQELTDKEAEIVELRQQLAAAKIFNTYGIAME